MGRVIELQVQLAKRRYVDPADIGMNCAVLAEKDQAFFWLEKAYAQKSDALEWIKVNRTAAALRSDPRYAPLVQKIRLPQYRAPRTRPSSIRPTRHPLSPRSGQPLT